ncbi:MULTISPECIES: MFS transporter [Mesorhizobium]|uniref:MFS transporter n=1 Tax=Mesorhizobium TaxID=68287 RepID=UPI0007A955E2|nr:MULTISPECIES: MFS transporter [Mesorhizobium]RUU24741.1 MFS transporter [Mesorhizobium sp. M7A.T.Ca.TU.009.01.3.2]RUV14722.1 MFS transporter [Mesorhizobium sp. M7A.T.Ca.TU.009.01.3.1]RUZ84594.1 MFS transporter [Mesorhizobium sp. M7A.F.Ca.US.003.02.2.1]RVA59082.1 MFS transporter [Mesorhizobium sp. M7A.F.Ca.US.001.01.1.1]WIE92738.1 MFS transporter [Mesorhizobium sp. WSM4875]
MSSLADQVADPNSPGAFAPLRNPSFRSIWFATQVSSLGWLMQTVAISWLMATISTSDLMVALVQASSNLPAFILSVFAGALADNFSRRRVMFAGRCLMVLASAMLTAFVVLGFVDPWMILGFSFLIACGGALHDPAWQASVGDMVNRRDVPAAVTLLSVGFNTVRTVGPALGGIVVASFGLMTAFAVTSLTYLVPLVTIWRCKWMVRSSPLPRESMRTAIYDGLRFTAMSSEIKTAITRGTLFGLASIAILALLPLVVRDQLGGGPLAYGTLMAGFGTGAVFAGISNSVFRRSLSQERLMTLACVACAACSLSLALTSSIAVAAIALAMGGAGWVTAWSGVGVTVQLASPRWVVGRTISIYYALIDGGIAAGSWVWGTVAQNHSLTLALEGSAGALLLVAATGLLFPLRERRESDPDALEDFDAPAVALNLKPRSGPIVVKVEYLVPEENREAFLELMRARRHVHSRVGARHWTLQRNLQEPMQWIETFRTPTWTDYLRLNHRLTEADKELGKQVLKLHAGQLPPKIMLFIERPTSSALKSDESARYFLRH